MGILQDKLSWWPEDAWSGALPGGPSRKRQDEAFVGFVALYDRRGAIGVTGSPRKSYALRSAGPSAYLGWSGTWPLRDWAQAVRGQLVLFGRMERLAGQLTHIRQGERVVAWRERPYQNGYPADDLARYCTAYGIEAGPTRLETMRRLVLHLTEQEPLVLAALEQEGTPHQGFSPLEGCASR